MGKIEKLSKIQLIFIILAFGFLVYLNSLFNGFVWDDEEQILKNPLIQNFSNLPLIFKYSTFYGGGGAPTGWFYRPMMTLSYLVNYSLFGPNAFGFHFFQLIIHLLNAILIFLIFSEIFSREKFSNSKLIGFLAALIFAVHPGNVEAVSYIAALQEVLYTLFALIALFVLLRLGDYRRRKFLYFLFLGFLIFLSLLSKESALFIIPLIFVFLFFFQKEKIIGLLFSSILAILSYFFLRLAVAKVPFLSPNVGPVAEASFVQRLMTIPYETVSYLRIIFFPKDLFISQHTLITSFSDFRFWGFLLLLLPFFVFLIWFGIREKLKLFFFFAFWFWGSIFLVLNILPLDMTVAERWLYFPLIGFLGMMGVIIEKLKIKNIKLKIFGAFLMVIVISSFSVRTVLRNFDWKDGLTLYGHDIRINPDAFDLQNNYGVELFRVGKIDEAKEHFERSIELYPRWWFAYNNLGVVYERKGDLERARKLYEQTLEISDYYLAYENLGFILLRTASPKEASSFLEKAILKFPQNPRLKVAQALVYYKEGRQEEAERAAQEAYFLEPSVQNRALVEAIMSKKKIDF